MHMLAFFTPNLQLCDFGFYGAVLELASKKGLTTCGRKESCSKRRTGIRKEEKDGRNRNASGRKTVPGQNQHKQRTYPQKTSGEVKNGICPERHLFNSTAVCRTVSRLLAGTDGNPAYGGDKHGGRSYSSSDYRRAFYRAVCGKRLWHGAEKPSDKCGERIGYVPRSGTGHCLHHIPEALPVRHEKASYLLGAGPSGRYHQSYS